MTKNLAEQCQHIYQLNNHLLTLARQGKWDEFIGMAEDYVVMLADMLNNGVQGCSTAEREDIGILFQHLIENEAEMNTALKNRLEALKKELSTLHHGKKCSQAYSAPFSPTFH